MFEIGQEVFVVTAANVNPVGKIWDVSERLVISSGANKIFVYESGRVNCVFAEMVFLHKLDALLSISSDCKYFVDHTSTAIKPANAHGMSPQEILLETIKIAKDVK